MKRYRPCLHSLVLVLALLLVLCASGAHIHAQTASGPATTPGTTSASTTTIAATPIGAGSCGSGKPLYGECMALRAGPAPGEKFTALSSGMFTYSKTDLTLAGAMPIVIQRVYRSRDYEASATPVARNFGLGTRLNYDIFLYSYSEYQGSPANYMNAEVVMPDGGELACGRDTSTCDDPSSCTDYTGPSSSNPAVFDCNEQPTGIWFDSTLTYNWNNSGWDLARKDGTVYHFGSDSLLQTITDRFGNSIAITRGGQELANCANPGQTISSSDIAIVSSSDGRGVGFCYDNSNYAHVISRIFDTLNGSPTGLKQVDYAYGSNHQLTTVTQTAYNPNATTTYSYAQTPNAGVADITTITTDVNGSDNYTYVTYGTDYNVSNVSNSVPSVGYQYANTVVTNSNGPPDNYEITDVTITLPDSTERHLSFDQAGYLTNDVRNSGNSNKEITVFSRESGIGNSNEFIGSVAEENSSGAVLRTTTYGWDPTTGDLTSVTISPGPGTNPSATWTYTYTSCDRLASATEPMGNTTTYTYSDQADCQHANDPVSTIMTVTDPLQRYTLVNYNLQGQVSTVYDEYQNASRISYNAYGDIQSTTDPLNDTTQYQTDADGRVTAVTSPLNETTTYEYDAEDHVTCRSDSPPTSGAASPVTTYSYNLVGALHSVTTPKGNTTCTATPNGYTTTYNWQPTLNSVTITDPLKYQAVVNFDANGRTQSYTDKRGTTTNFTYDNFGRLAKLDTNAVNFGGYQEDRSTTYQYDALDRVTGTTDTDLFYGWGGTQRQQTFTYTYDGIDDVMSEAQNTTFSGSFPYGQYPQEPSTINYQYDQNGRRTSATLTINTTPPVTEPTVNYAYDNADELVDMANVGPFTPSSSSSYCHTGDGSQVSFCYDRDGRRTGMESSNVLTQYSYDGASRLTELQYCLGPTGSPPQCNNPAQLQYGNLTYGYDYDSRVTDEGGTCGSGWVGACALAALNMPAAATMGYTSTDQVNIWNGNATNPNNNGDITKDPVTGNSYQWDLRNQLEVVGGGWDGMIYDPTGRRDDLPTGSAGTGLSNFADTYLYDGSQGIQASNSAAVVNYLRTPGSGEELMEETQSQNGNGAPQIPLLDGSGSTIAMVDSGTGNVASTYTYDPFGKVTIGGSGYETAYQYRGMENETLSGATWAYYGGGTYYSPVLGRPLTIQGPITSAGGFGAGPGAMVEGALPGGSGDVPVNPFLSVPGAAAPAYLGAEGAGVGLAVGSMFFTGVEAGSTYGPPGAIIGGLLGALAGVLEDLLGGGGPSEPWWWTREDTHPGGSPSTWAPILGMPAAYPPNQGKSAVVLVVEDVFGRPGSPLMVAPGDEGGGGYWGSEPEVNPGDLKVLSKSQLKGINAEEFKKDIVGKRGGKFNIAVAPNGYVYLVPASKGGGPPVAAGMTLDQLLGNY